VVREAAFEIDVPGFDVIAVWHPRNDKDKAHRWLRSRLAEVAKLDGMSLFLMAVALASLEIGLKQSPQDGWLSPFCGAAFSVSILCGGLFVYKTIAADHPVVQLSTFRERGFAIGCTMSFCLGAGLFGSVYLMPVFLAFKSDALALGFAGAFRRSELIALDFQDCAFGKDGLTITLRRSKTAPW
jgi:hypothetical protein